MEVKVSLIAAILVVAVLMVLSGPKAEAGVTINEPYFGQVSSIGDLIGSDEEMMMESEGSRRSLAAQQRYISYGALKANQVPCGRRGSSYYNCQGRQRANPYRRACTAITHCKRYTD